MLLADVDIKHALSTSHIVIDPLPDYDKALSACAIDLRLDQEFAVFEHTRIPYFDLRKPPETNLMKNIHIKPDESFILQPGEFALATTFEWVELPDDIAGRLEGRSSLGRLGIIVHSTAALIHPGWKGKIVLELSNLSRMPIALYPTMHICAMSFQRLNQPSERPYAKQKTSKYRNQKGVTHSRIEGFPHQKNTK